MGDRPLGRRGVGGEAHAPQLWLEALLASVGVADARVVVGSLVYRHSVATLTLGKLCSNFYKSRLLLRRTEGAGVALFAAGAAAFKAN